MTKRQEIARLLKNMDENIADVTFSTGHPYDVAEIQFRNPVMIRDLPFTAMNIPGRKGDIEKHTAQETANAIYESMLREVVNHDQT